MEDGTYKGTIVRAAFDGRCLDVDCWDLCHDNVVNVWSEHDDNRGTTFDWQALDTAAATKALTEHESK